ncbi:uncharacterized protein PV06_06528 [Exophiala oligosperma]|uniref:Tafazzin n=1 Tax=Exophiala oligosperma TaxID=215243 RepID=A0A0D2ALR1_9EURO|nr:uncharacterized protein PV06_06528 [Exophiala oligosperma]KIW40921.1 hypothetical protein PV06_06528 [Exophiala oligosperma]
MPKKHQQKALLTKPQSSTPHTLSSSSKASHAHNEPAQRSVNDLIRESRLLQRRNEPRPPAAPANTAASIPPALRSVLDLPPPPAPVLPQVRSNNGPSRLRRIPGPPPPRSWLTDSIHAPALVRAASTTAGYHTEGGGGQRIQVRTSKLPGCSFPPARSLQHLTLKKIASNWSWHVENDQLYFPAVPANLKETLLSYIAVYNEAPINPLRPLFLNDYNNDPEDRIEVHRLDLSNGLGLWTTFKQLERDLVTKQVPATKSDAASTQSAWSSEALDSWDAESDIGDASNSLPLTGPKATVNFVNLKHLSLAVSPANIKVASWSSMLSLAAELRTLTSLSLAYWPQPTLTPNAASTRAVLHVPGSPSVVYGGSDMYTAYDDNWREAAGILRTLSRSLYCLEWLDLTGCGDWYAALKWRPESSESSSPQRYGPEWNSGWRGLEKLILDVGWKPLVPAVQDSQLIPDQPPWDIEHERRTYRYNKERQRHGEIRNMAQSVSKYLRAIRKECGGRWIDVEIGEELPQLDFV